jgi:AraC-like DNA-binding protein
VEPVSSLQATPSLMARIVRPELLAAGPRGGELDVRESEMRSSALLEWLNLGIDEKHRDLVSFLGNLPDPEPWLSLEAYQGVAPSGAPAHEHALFLCELKVILPRTRSAAGPIDWRVSYLIDAAQRPVPVGLTLRQLSRRLRASEQHLGVLFRRHTEERFHVYLRACRISHAAELLRGSTRTVRKIAVATGHKDPSNFVRDFRAEIGITPAAYRNAVRERMVQEREVLRLSPGQPWLGW